MMKAWKVLGLASLICGFGVTACKERGVTSAKVASTKVKPRKLPPRPSDLSGLAAIPVSQDPLPAHCASPANPIVAENCLPGQPPGDWDVPFNDPANNGFTDKYSYAAGETIDFRMRSTRGVTLKIYRMGYYRGLGGRLVATVSPSIAGALSQPDCLKDLPLHFVHCENWAVSARWVIPAAQVSGVYVAKMEFSDRTGGSLIPFVIRNEGRQADVLLQTSDANWQAYNWFGGMNTYERMNYEDPPPGEPVMSPKVSYMRPLAADEAHTGSARNWHFNFFSDHYPAIRWFEKNGFNVNYIAGKDVANPARLSYLKAHKVFVSLGHDEYWSQSSRDHIHAARDNTATSWGSGTSLIFMSGNTMFEKIRWENDYQTLVTYKQSRLLDWPSDPGLVGDPLLNTDQTGYFRDGRYRHHGYKPENETMGLLFTTMNNVYYPMTVPASYAGHRFWRQTAVASLTGTQIYKSTSPYMLGYELDEDIDNGYRPAGLMHLSSTHFSGVIREISVFGSGMDYVSGNLDHHMSLYRAPGGAYVWATGSIFFSFALDTFHERYLTDNEVDDKQVQQATVNMLADMKVQPGSLIAPLRVAVATTDITAPKTVITNLAASNAQVMTGTEYEIRGTATDQGGVVGAVEVSTDGGTTWHPANGTGQWSYRWTPGVFGTVVIKARAVDDSGNLETPTATANVQVVAKGSFWNGQNLGTLPAIYRNGWHELGLRFAADTDGIVTSVSFYKNHGDTKSYPVTIWDESGNILGQGSRVVSSTVRGWVKVPLSAPVTVQRGKTYTASYRTDGYFSYHSSFLNPATRLYSHPLKELGSAYAQGPFVSPQASFPVKQNPGFSYFVDIEFSASTGQSPRVSLMEKDVSAAVTGAYRSTTDGYELGMKFQAQTDGLVHGVRFYKDARNSGLHTVSLWRRWEDNATGNVDPARPEYPTIFRLAWTSAVNETASGWQDVYFEQPVSMSAGQTYIASYRSRSGYQIGSSAALPASRIYNAPLKFISGMWSTDPYPTIPAAEQYGVDVIFEPTASRKSTLYAPSTSPQIDYAADVAGGRIVPYELGTRFVSESDGYVTGVRFFVGKSSAGAHTARLWLNSRTTAPLATTTAPANAFGWVEAPFSQPVRILAGRIYTASYSTNLGFPITFNYFAHPFGTLVPPLRATGTVLPPLNDPFPLNPTPESGGKNGVVGKGLGVYPRDWGWHNYFVEPVFTTSLAASGDALDAACVLSKVGAACGTNRRCNASGQCVTCGSWCSSGSQCFSGTNSCAAAGAPVCAISAAPANTFCRTTGGGLGKCNGAGVCNAASTDI